MFDNVEFETGPKHFAFNTKVNGDLLVLTGLVLTAEQAARLAYLINQPKSLRVEIKTI